MRGITLKELLAVICEDVVTTVVLEGGVLDDWEEHTRRDIPNDWLDYKVEDVFPINGDGNGAWAQLRIYIDK